MLFFSFSLYYLLKKAKKFSKYFIKFSNSAFDVSNFVKYESLKLRSYNSSIYENINLFKRLNYSISPSLYKENEEENKLVIEREIIDFTQLNKSLDNIKEEYLDLKDYLTSKVSMKFTMEVSVMIITIVFTLIGLIG